NRHIQQKSSFSTIPVPPRRISRKPRATTARACPTRILPPLNNLQSLRRVPKFHFVLELGTLL
ncbi:hypothetical protein HispidOSU_018459, partial [Sigmodon hispidus]